MKRSHASLPFVVLRYFYFVWYIVRPERPSREALELRKWNSEERTSPLPVTSDSVSRSTSIWVSSMTPTLVIDNFNIIKVSSVWISMLSSLDQDTVFARENTLRPD